MVVRGDSAKEGIFASSISLTFDGGVGMERNDRSSVFSGCSLSLVKMSKTGRPRAKERDWSFCCSSVEGRYLNRGISGGENLE